MSQAATLLGTITQLDRTWYKDQFLEHYFAIPVLYDHGQAAMVDASIPMNSGSTVNWFRYHPLARKTAGRSEGKTSYTAQALKGMTVESGVEIWDSVVTYSEKTFYAGRDGGLTGGAQVLGEQAGESVEQETMKIMAEAGCWPFPRNAYNATTGAMLASQYVEGLAAAITGTTSAFYTNSLKALDQGDKKDGLIGGWGCVSGGRGYGHGFRISDSSSSGGTGGVAGITITPVAPEALTSEVGLVSTVTIGLPNASTRGLTAGDTMTTAFLLKAKTILKKNKAKTFADGTYHAFIDPDVVTQLMALDTTWISQMTQQHAEKGERGYIGTWAGINFYECLINPRYPVVTATANAISFTSGVMRLTLIMGRDSFGKVGIGGLPNDPQLIFKALDSGGVANPTNSYGTMAWKLVWKIKPLNANWCVGAMTYMA